MRSFLAPLFYCLFIFISIYLIIDLFGHLDEIINEHVGMRILFIYYLAYMPSIFVQIMPIAILIATMYTLGNFARHNEIIALRSSGIGLWNILKPFLVTGFFVSAFILIINDRVVPRSTHLFLQIKEEKIEKKKTSSASGKIVKDVALYGQGNKIIFARSYDPKTSVLKDVVIHEQDRRQNIISKITAKEARWSKDKWIAFNVITYKLDGLGQISEEPAFQHRAVLNLKETPQEFQRQKYKTELLTLSELKTNIRRLSGTSGLVLKNLKVEAESRIAYPFTNLVAVLIGAAFCMRTRRSSRLLGIGLGFLIGFLFYGVFAVSVALGKGGILAPFISVWFPNILFGALGIHLINKY